MYARTGKEGTRARTGGGQGRGHGGVGGGTGTGRKKGQTRGGGGGSHPSGSNPPVSALLATVSLTKAYATIYSHFSPRPLPGIFLRSVTISELSEFMPIPLRAWPWRARARILIGVKLSWLSRCCSPRCCVRWRWIFLNKMNGNRTNAFKGAHNHRYVFDICWHCGAKKKRFQERYHKYLFRVVYIK